ncbi:MAG: ion transporter [Flavobacteriaceae bacterium]|nr:ion transporter [Flavobacteriaceae bacterium]
MTWKEHLHEIIYEADTPLGKAFDVILLILILLSLALVMLDSVDFINTHYHNLLHISEWVITIAFTVEYFLRILVVKKPTKYIFSFYGIIDFLATIPLYLSLILTGSGALLSLRALRLLRVFRILKLERYFGAGNFLITALKKSLPKIFIFIYTVVIVSFVAGAVMYMIEGPQHGFTSIPQSIYWTIVTLTTVGYGDIYPVTPFGQFVASIIMILGYGIIAVPTGVVTAEMTFMRKKTNTVHCRNCGENDHKSDAQYYLKCGHSL